MTYNEDEEQTMTLTVTPQDGRSDGNMTGSIKSEIDKTYAGMGYVDKATRVEITNGISAIGADAFENFPNLKTVEIPNSVTSIGSEAFARDKKLDSIPIPASVTELYGSAFRGCNLAAFEVDANNRTFTTDASGALLSGTTLVSYPPARTGGNTIPAGVTEIGAEAFYGITSLDELTIPATVTTIGKEAFRSCGLKTLAVEGGAAPLSVGEFAFFNMSELETLRLGARTIDASAGQVFDSSYGTQSGETLKVEYAGTAAALREALQTGNYCAPVFEKANFECQKTGSPTETATVYKIGFSANGASGYMNTLVMENGETLTLPSPTAYRSKNGDNAAYGFSVPSGGVFQGWEVDGAVMQPGESFAVSKSISAKAIWYYKIRFDYGQDDSSTPYPSSPGGTINIVNNKASARELPAPTWVGHVFDGWYLNGEKVTINTSYPPGTDVTLTAHWTTVGDVSPVNVTFDCVGGSLPAGTPDPFQVKKGQRYDAISGSLPTPVHPSGYRFAGWNYETDSIRNDTLFLGDEGPTLTASWSGSGTITFDANGGKIYYGGWKDSCDLSQTNNQPYNLPNSSSTYLKYDGYRFVGWYTERDGGYHITTEGSYGPGSPTVLYAHWSRIAESFDELRYGFANSGDDFGYRSNYKFP